MDTVRDWLSRFICTVHDSDLDLLSLWAVHTHLVEETYTTPRLVIDSPVPGSGKTTVLEHLQRLCVNPVQMASIGSPALLARLLDAGMRTILIDEADRSLNPKNDGIQELIAILNSGYKRGGSRPTLVPSKEEGWVAKELPTYAPVAMAGNNPDLPEDTRSRSIRVLLMPDIDGSAEESDWEMIEEEADRLGDAVALWADAAREVMKTERPPLPEGVKGRARERWSPLKRVASVAGGRWPTVVDALALADVHRIEIEREDGLTQQRPAVVLLKDVHEVWGADEQFVSTEILIQRLIMHNPDMWGPFSSFGKKLTAQRLGRMLSAGYNLQTSRPVQPGPRGYLFSTLQSAFRRSGLGVSSEPAIPTKPVEPDNVYPLNAAVGQ